jgi:hypothetical protein
VPSGAVSELEIRGRSDPVSRRPNLSCRGTFVESAVLLKFEVDECVDHCVIHATDNLRRNAFPQGKLAPALDHRDAAAVGSHGLLVGLVARSLLDELLASGQELHDCSSSSSICERTSSIDTTDNSVGGEGLTYPELPAYILLHRLSEGSETIRCRLGNALILRRALDFDFGLH